PPAEAKDTLSCTKSYEGSQVLKKKGELLAARQQLIACMRDCPGAIQQECTTWFENLEPLIPSIVIHVESAGEDRSDVREELDGKALNGEARGKGDHLRPGAATVKFHARGSRAVDKRCDVPRRRKAPSASRGVRPSAATRRAGWTGTGPRGTHASADSTRCLLA